MNAINDFISDVNRYQVLRNRSRLYLILSQQGLWALAEYRFSHWVHANVRILVLRQCMKLFCFVWHKLIEATTGIDLPHQAEIGKGLYIGHFGNIFLFSSVKIGEYCNLSQGVTIGIGGRGSDSGCPTVGDRVFFGPGAKVFGAITIGNDVAIGANAVVTKDLPDSAVAVGIPAKIISYEGSQDLVIVPKEDG